MTYDIPVTKSTLGYMTVEADSQAEAIALIERGYISPDAFFCDDPLENTTFDIDMCGIDFEDEEEEI